MFTTPEAVAEKLIKLRDSLIKLKQDRTTYVKSSSVVRLYDELCEYIRQAQEFESELLNGPRESGSKLGELVTDCYELISLLFLTVGRNNEPPAVYAPSVIIKRLLEHLNESGNFSRKDLVPLQRTLINMRENIEQGRPLYNSLIISMLESQVCASERSLKELKKRLEPIPSELESLLERLVSLRRSIKACESKKQFQVTEVEGYLSQIKEIDASRIDGKFVAEDGNIPETGQDILDTLLKRCYIVAENALQKQGAVAPGLKTTYEELFQAKSQLEKLELTQAWSLRETDLYEFQKLVLTLDQERVNGKFVDSEGNAPGEGQGILLYMVRRCYAHIYSLINSSEPVSEALTPVFNQLQTVRRCLKEVQKFGISNARDLYPYSMKLASIDNMRVDGKFMNASRFAKNYEIARTVGLQLPKSMWHVLKSGICFVFDIE
ncbi:uncharacterized protein LAJ45_00904 [Morchella importuna]|uniref:uncharacterized protein n=1 Tax=Morchella importuna TaxID=1174673 RepID=UPI001E8D930D|nr:uncharacterized protein LAJ45_00904 [Morchella importuna]KAH8155892.1 hypothetical protein LAJ45_00904 [Morchella importuna]